MIQPSKLISLANKLQMWATTYRGITDNYNAIDYNHGKADAYEIAATEIDILLKENTCGLPCTSKTETPKELK